MAPDFLHVDKNVDCHPFKDVKCGEVQTYTSMCVDGMAMVDLWVYDKMLGQIMDAMLPDIVEKIPDYDIPKIQWTVIQPDAISSGFVAWRYIKQKVTA